MFKQNQIAAPSLCSHYMKQAFRAFHGIPYHGCDNAPNKWGDLKKWGDFYTLGNDSLPVYSGDCDFSIYSSADDNIMFRAWHDSIHLKNGLSFSYDDELAAGKIHLSELVAIGTPYHVAQIIYYDVVAQVMFYYRFKEYVRDQKRFITYVINNGLNAIPNYKQ